jgi:hypothetical protein
VTTVAHTSATAAFQPPGLLAGPADFDQLRKVVSQPGLHQDLARFVQACADRELTEDVAIRQITGRRMLQVSRAILRRVANGGITYQLTGDKRYARRALADLLAASAFSDWNPSHFLDTAEMSCAFALGLDWLHTAMTPDERRQLEDALIRLGLEPSLNPPDPFWLTTDNNWNAVCHGSLTLGALAVRHRSPDLAQKIIDRALQALPLHGHNFAPEGAFAEGAMYWDYGTTFHVLVTEALRRVTGSTHGLDTLPGFRESGTYMVHVTGPSGQDFNYSDARLQREPLPALPWFGRHYDQPWLTRHEARQYARALAKPLKSEIYADHRFFGLALLWFNPEHLKSSDATIPSLAWSGQGPNPVAFWRDAWTPDATWVGAKGGRATISHGHIDAGTFVVETGGVRWAVDTGMEEYHRIETMGIKIWGADRWTLFRLGPESHSIPRLDGITPDPAGNCPRIAWTDTPRPSVTFDLTRLYPKHLTRLHRTIAAQADGRTGWRDEIDGLASGQTYRFTWMTTADVKTDASGATLTQDGRRLRIEARSDQRLAISVVDATTLYKAPDSPVPGLKRLEFAITSPGSAFALSLSAGLVR